MSAEMNKEVVRRFIREVLSGSRVESVDELLAPGYVNRAFGVDLPAFKEMLAGLTAALPDRKFDVEELVAEEDAVVARFTLEVRGPDDRPVAFRGLTYYRLVNGKIVEDDPITTPDLTQTLGPLIAPAPA